MKTVRRIAIGIGVLIGAALLFLTVVVDFGTAESRLLCQGEVVRSVDRAEPVIAPATLYARVETYRWIVFWYDHDAMIFWEILPIGETGFGYYSNSSFGTPITDLAGAKQYGYWSSLSRRIVVEAAGGDETFTGMCKPSS